MGDSETLRDRRRDEGVRRGDDHECVSGLAVRLHEVLGGREHDGLDQLGDEPLAQRFEMRARVLAQGAQRESQEFSDIQGAVLVFAIEALVLALVIICIDDPRGGQESAPQIIGVACQEGVVQIEDRQRHVVSFG